MSIQNNTTQLQNLLEQVNELPNGGAEAVLQEKTVDPSTTTLYVTPDSAYDGLSKVTVNAMTVVEQAVPIVSVGSGGNITARATQTSGYVVGGTKTGEFQMVTQAAKTVTPSTSEQPAVASGVYTTGAVKVAGDANLVAENIAEGVSIFGVTGSHTGGEDVTDETTAYTTKLAALETAMNELNTELDGKAAGGGSVEYVGLLDATNAMYWSATDVFIDDYSQKAMRVLSSVQYDNIIKGSYICVPVYDTSSFPIVATPSDAVELVRTFQYLGVDCNVYKINADCEFRIDD